MYECMWGQVNGQVSNRNSREHTRTTTYVNMREHTVNIQNFGAAKFRHFTIFDISAAIYFRRGVEGTV